MSNRTNSFNVEALSNLYANHPYLIIFKKDDWMDYLMILASIYDLLEEERSKVPYETLRSLVVRYYGQSNLSSVEHKVHQFFLMMIGEMAVLRDSHDQLGQRYIETTKFGKELLIMVEKLLAQRVRYSGTGAETLLGALNNIMQGNDQLSDTDAIEHHKQKIISYQKDIQKIRKHGALAAELLPLPHSNEALFSQAEEAAIHIISSIEDVKLAIEKQRQILAESYFEMKLSPGQNINTITDFYERLYVTPEYVSYNQAKNLLSYLDGFSNRFPQKNVDHLLHQIQKRNLLSDEMIKHCHLNGFMSFFRSADQSIQEKIRTQISLLQQQVFYALSTDVQGLQVSLQNMFSSLMENRVQALGFFDEEPIAFTLDLEFDFGPINLFHFESPPDIATSAIQLNELDQDEKRRLFDSLLQAEETTIHHVLEHIRSTLKAKSSASLHGFPFRYGLGEFYVLSEISLFDQEIIAHEGSPVDVEVPTKHGAVVIRKTINYIYYFKEAELNGTH